MFKMLLSGTTALFLCVSVGLAQPPQQGQPQQRQGQPGIQQPQQQQQRQQQQHQQQQQQRQQQQGLQAYQGLSAQQFLKQHDKNNDNSLSQEELPEVQRRAFRRIDTNSDNKLSLAELQAHGNRMQRMRPVGVTYIWIVESDRDQHSLKDLQQSYQLLRRLDQNNDGQITKQEIQQARKDLVKEHIQAFIQEADENNDQKISHDEAQGFLCESDFSRLDQNQDQHLTREELMNAIRELSSPTSIERDQ